jgi:hypothetical protein
MKRPKKFEKELNEYRKPIEENLQRLGVGRRDVACGLSILTKIL